MGNAQKLPSGSYRVRLYVGKDADGKAKYVSFTAPTKREAEFEAAKFAKTNNRGADLTFKQALEQYIQERSNTLSPGTLRSYKLHQKSYQDIDNILMYKLNQRDIQNHINKYAIDHSPKTVRNHHGLISAVMKYYRPEYKLNTSLPKKARYEVQVPTEEEVNRLLEFAKNEKPELYIPILLGAFAPCRRGEVSAIVKSDLKGDILHISKAYTRKDGGGYVLKSPKSYAGDRYIPLPPFVVDALNDRFSENDTATDLNPDAITKMFVRECARLLGKSYRFHDLRHFCASMLHASGMSNSSICKRCGWENDNVLIEIYRHTVEEIDRDSNDHANDVFSKKFS